MRDAERSIVRGIGPALHAMDFRLENLVSHGNRKMKIFEGGPICPVDVGACMSLWMLRGMEAAAILGDQVYIDPKLTTAAIDLGPTKTDISGRGCRRTLICACQEKVPTIGFVDVCPVHALARICVERERLGLSGKHPLFPQANGRASTVGGLCRTVSNILKGRITEHSFRRAGAQYYARRGVPVPVIQFLGRWGSETIFRYIGEALDATARSAARVAAACALSPSCPPALQDNMGPVVEIARELNDEMVGMKTAEDIVARAVAAAQMAIDESCKDLEIRLVAAAEVKLGAVRPVGKMSSRSHTHRIALGDSCFPTGVWTTACGWRFGSTQHVRVDVSEINCASCIRCTSSRDCES